MPYGKTVEMIRHSRMMRWAGGEDRPKRERDRSLPGKARIRARRQAKRDNQGESDGSS